MVEQDRRVECGLAVVHPWLCDAMGHLTTRHYAGFFDDAAYQLFALAGYDPQVAALEGWGWADVRHEIDFTGELAAGAIVRIVGQVTKLGRTSLTSEYALIDRAGERICARLTARTVCFDLQLRRARPLPPSIIASIASRFAIVPPSAPS